MLIVERSCSIWRTIGGGSRGEAEGKGRRASDAAPGMRGLPPSLVAGWRWATDDCKAVDSLLDSQPSSGQVLTVVASLRGSRCIGAVASQSLPPSLSFQKVGVSLEARNRCTRQPTELKLVHRTIHGLIIDVIRLMLGRRVRRHAGEGDRDAGRTTG